MNDLIGVAVAVTAGLWLLCRAGVIAHAAFAAVSRSVRRGARPSHAVIAHALHGAGRLTLLLSAAALACAVWIAIRMSMLST